MIKTAIIISIFTSFVSFAINTMGVPTQKIAKDLKQGNTIVYVYNDKTANEIQSQINN